MPRLNNSVFNAIRSVLPLLIWQDVACMRPLIRNRRTKRNEHLESRIRSVAVTCDRPFLRSLFDWLLSPVHFPELASISRNSRKRKLRAYRLLSGRVSGLMKRFPDEKARLMRVSAIISERVSSLSEARSWVTYVSKDGKHSWYGPKGPQPAMAPRLLLAACIARALDPTKSPYDLVVKQLSDNGHSMERRAVEMQIRRLLDSPKKHPVYGADRTTDDLVVLLRQELLDFKIWKEDQSVDRTKMSIEEFDSQFEDYLGRIHPSSEEVELLSRLLDNFRNRPTHT